VPIFALVDIEAQDCHSLHIECRLTVNYPPQPFSFSFFHSVNHGSSGSFKVHAVDNDPQMTEGRRKSKESLLVGDHGFTRLVHHGSVDDDEGTINSNRPP
jgi:hypothetical protein